MLEAVKWRHLPVFFLLSLLVCPTVFGLFKKDKGSLVENAIPGMLYLFMFPRTATTPSQAALNLKVETWLKWENIRFHRLSNQFILGSQTDGTAPFAYYKEENDTERWINGSDAIIDFVVNMKKDKNDKKERTETAEEKKLRNTIDNTLFKVLMLDRATRDKQTGKRGLDWMLRDEGIAVQIMPALVPDMKLNVFKIENVQYQIHLNLKSWKAYFDLYKFSELQAKIFPNEQHATISPSEENKWKKIIFLRKYLEKDGVKVDENDQALTMEHWNQANDTIISLINTALRTTFKALLKDSKGIMQPNAKSSEAKLDALLEENFIDDDKKTSFNSLYGKGDEILKIVKKELKPFLDYTKTIHNFFNPKRFQTPTGASLFGVLVQFFETPLNIPQLKAYFQPEKGKKLSKDAKKLKEFVKNVKKSLKINDDKWSKLKQKPWTLNYENVNVKSTDKYNGPFSVETDDLNDIFDNFGYIIMDMEIGEPKNAVEAAVKKINNFADAANFFAGPEFIKIKMVRLMAAYLCNLGKGEALENECFRKHKEEAGKQIGAIEVGNPNFSLVKKLTYDAIVEYNEELVRKNVMNAIKVAQTIAAKPDPKIAASASSLAKIGNEL